MQKPTIKNNDKAEIRKSYAPSAEEMELLQRVYLRESQMKEGRAKYDVNWDRWEKQWESYREINTDWKTNIVPPLSTSIVETIMAEVQQFEIEPPIKARGTEDLYKVDVMKEAVKFSKQQGSFKIEEADIKKDAFVFGNGFGEELLWQNSRELRFAKEKWEKGKKITFMDTVKTFDYNGMLLEHVPIRSLLFDEAAKSINTGRRQANDCIREFVMTKESAYDFLSDPRWNQRNNLQYVQTGKKSDFYQFYEPLGRIDPADEVQVLFYWCKRPDYLIIVANDVLVYADPNPYNHKLLPFVQAYDIRRTNSLYHKGEMELLDSIQEELTKNRRARLDRSHLTIDPGWLVRRSANLSEDDLLAEPHHMVEVDDLEAAREIRPTDTPVSAYKEEEALLRDAQRVSGVDDGSQSVQRTSGTATEFAGLREATLRKVSLKLWYIHNGFHVDWARLRVANIQQFMSEEQMVRVLGDKKTAQYKKMVNFYKEKGMYAQKDGEDYMKMVPNIRTEGKRFVRNGGEVKLEEAKGTFFFTPEPEDLLPFYGGFDIEYDGTPQIPLTKSLRQTKVAELTDRVLPVALAGIGNYDPGKVIDILVKEYDWDPDQLKTAPVEEEGGADELGMAQAENNQMMQGTPLPPTPMVTEAHTRVHLAFMKSRMFQENQDQMVTDAFTKHVLGENMAQQQRKMGGNGEMGGQMAGDQPTKPSIQGVDGKISGGGQVEQGLPKGGKVGSSPIGSMLRKFIGG